MATETDRPGIVIPNLNSGDGLARLITSLRKQTTPCDEIIVVDGGSTDSSLRAARSDAVTLLVDVGPGDRRSRARNIGADASRCEVLLFLDSDMEAPPNLLEACYSSLQPGTDAVLIPEITAGSGWLGRVRAWERKAISREPLLTFPRLIRRRAFRDAGGFDESLAGFEDLDLGATLIENHARIGISAVSLIHHEESLRLPDLMYKRRHYLVGAPRYARKHPASAARVFSAAHRVQLYVQAIESPADTFSLAVAVILRLSEITRVPLASMTPDEVET